MTLLAQAVENFQRRAPHLFPVEIGPKARDSSAVAELWNSADEARRCPGVFASYGLSMLGTMGLRVLDGGIIVPLRIGKDMVNAQIADARGVRLYGPGQYQPFVIERPRAAMTCVAASILDALAVFQSVRTARVVCAIEPRSLPAFAGSVAMTDRLFDRDTEGHSAIAALKEWGEAAPRRIERTVLAAARVAN